MNFVSQRTYHSTLNVLNKSWISQSNTGYQRYQQFPACPLADKWLVHCLALAVREHWKLFSSNIASLSECSPSLPAAIPSTFAFQIRSSNKSNAEPYHAVSRSTTPLNRLLSFMLSQRCLFWNNRKVPIDLVLWKKAMLVY